MTLKIIKQISQYADLCLFVHFQNSNLFGFSTPPLIKILSLLITLINIHF